MGKAQVASALAEIEPGRSMIETSFADAIDASLVDAEYVGFTTAMKHCANVSVSLSPDGSANIGCDVLGGSLVTGKRLLLNRSASGVWTCNASQFNARIRPNGCS
ncbi:pilin [Xanthomonas campestris pv. armoraciae]|nr:pilin [Xanthomonas campestris pv. armoraciae]